MEGGQELRYPRPIIPAGPHGPLSPLGENASPDRPESLPYAVRESMKNYDPEVNPLLADCEKVGWFLNGPWDLVSDKKKLDDRLFPILAEHALKSYPLRAREGMILSLSRKEARVHALQTLRYILKEEAHLGHKGRSESAANALVTMSTKDDVPWMRAMLRDEKYGDNRVFFLSVYARLAKKEAIPELRYLLDRGYFVQYTINELGKLQDTGSRAKIAAFLNHTDADVQRFAKKALERLAKAETKH
jgi:hypothetical protein